MAFIWNFLFQVLSGSSCGTGVRILLFPQQNPFVVVDCTVGNVGQIAALYADGMYFGHFVCNGTQGRNGTEGNSFIIHVESGHNHTDAVIGQFVADFRQSFVKELGFIDAYHVNLGSEKQDACRRVNRSRRNGIVVVRHHFFF